MAVLKLHNIPEIRIVNRSELSEIFECSLTTIDDRVKAGMPVLKRPTETDKGWQFDYLRCIEWLVKRDNGLIDADFDPNNLSPADRKNWYDSELKRIQLEEKQRKLIPSDDVEMMVTDAYGVFAQNMRSIPDNLERDLSLSGKVAEHVEVFINQNLEGLEKALVRLVKKNAQ